MNAVLSSIRGLVVLGCASLQVCQGQVLINEFVATSSDRLLHREPGQYPRVGNTTPWQLADYDDSLWKTGAGPFGFGTFSGVTLGTELSAMLRNRGASLYLRKTFHVTPAQAASGATLQLVTRYNDCSHFPWQNTCFAIWAILAGSSKQDQQGHHQAELEIPL